MDEAKAKCVELMVKGNECGGITERRGGFELRLGPSFGDNSNENSFVLYYYMTEEDFEIDITFEK